MSETTTTTITELCEALGWDIGHWRVRFQGEEYVFVGDRNEPSGAIATREQYENNATSFAYLQPDGKIVSFFRVIGTVEDLEWLDEDELQTDH
jgi:hypothetical protein